jgi:hypothetical protein
MKCYINGILETTTTVSINTSGNTPLFIGKSAASFSGNFDGQLDEFRIWNTARTFSEINANKDNELVGNESGLIAYYNFNQGISGGDNMGLTTLNDLTSNNNGTLNNFALTGLASNWVGACANGLNGTTPTPQPEINLQGNGTSIADGDATPSITDNTDFGNIVNGTPNTVTYTIQNTETGSSLTVADIVVSGANAGDFVVSDFTNNTTVAGNTTTTFDLTFTPSALETRTAIITINNNDCDEAEYDFAVQGAGIGSNNALDFDAGDYVRIPHNNALNVDETHTVEFWLKVNSNLGTFISRKENGGVGIDMFGNNAMQHVTWGDDALYSGALQTDGNWHHYAFVARGSGDRELFVDGISFGTNTTPYSMNTGTNDMYLGFTNNTGIMTLDEYRLWDVARTQTEINNNMNTELTGVEAGLIAYYTFDEGTAGANNTGITAPEIIDQAGCNNGIMNNFAKNGTTSNWVNSSSTITEVSQVIKGDINLQGNGSSIANGDATPSTTDDTDFGSSDFGVTGQTVTYTIQNTVAGSQLSVASIEINGAGTAEFSIANFVPNTVINGVNSSTFDVTFTPNAIGPRNATITINNNDCDDASYNFAIQGTGTGTAPANALDFDGTDDHIDISHFERPDTMTIEAWIKSDLATSGGAIVGWAGNTNNFAELLNVGNNVRYCEWDGANYLCSENVDVSDGNWHHIAVVRNGNTTNNLSIYKDGFLIGTNTVNSTITTNDLKIGAIDWFGNLFRIFMGQIDEVRIWNTARTCSEINANKDNELVGDETGLIAYYNFNQGIAGEDNTGLTALDDLKSNNNDGTLTNFALTGVASNWVDASANGVGGTTPGAAPEINVQGNGTSIADGDATPSITDDTDFANIVNGTPNTVTYTIQNTEAGSSLTVADIVVSGANAGDFVVSDFINNTTVAGNATTTFDLTFTPSALGNRTAIITINNNDCDEGLYDFAVRGTSVEPCITPTNLSVSNITTTTADLSWDAGVNESNGYDYVLITDGSTPDGTTTATGSVPTGEVTQTLTGLTLGTTYDVYVRSDCTVNVSDWSVVESFTTLCFGTDYTGNANTGFGDVVGNSSLNFTDDGTTITGTFTKGSGDFNDAMVMYISTGETGRAVIDINVNDEGDPLRRAISSAGTDGSVITFPSGFQATHAIAINVGFGGLWSIPATGTVGNNGLPFIEEVGSPAINTEASFSFSFNWSDVGLTSQDDFSFVVTYLNSSNGSTSNEAYSDGITGGNPGTTDFSFTNARNYPFYYVFDGTSWSPTNPDSVNENCRSAILRSGTAVFSSSTTLKEIKVNPQAVLDLDADLNADVLFKGDANGSAQLADATGITLSGNVTVERFIPAGNRAFRFLASPVTSTGSINDNWQEGATTANINPNPGFGAHITGVSGTVGNVNANGLDETQTGNPSMFTFNNTNTGNQNNAWSSVTNTNTNILEAGDPYLLLLRGDRSIDLSINNPNSTATTLRATGELFTGSHSPLLSEVEDYYSFVANPYQAVVNMNNVSTSNVNPNFFWYWDPNLNSSTFGGYINVNILTGVSNVLSAANQFLQPGQAIFVQTLSSGPASITFDENDKAVNSIQTGVFNEPLSSIKMLLYRTQALNDGERETDGVVINFEDNANNAIDALDGNKFFNSGENIARSQNNKYVSIENRAIPQNNEVLDIFTNNLNSSTYSFVVNANGIQDNFDVFLMDGYLGTTAQLTEGLYQYDFIADTNIPESIASDRFSLVFENTTLSLDDNNLGVDFSLYPNPTQDGQFTIQSQAISSDDFEIKIHNILGQEVFHEAYKNNANGSINIDASGLSSGVYIVEFYQNAKTLVTKLIVE